ALETPRPSGLADNHAARKRCAVRLPPPVVAEIVDVELVAEPDVSAEEEPVVAVLAVQTRVVVERDVGEEEIVVVVAEAHACVVAHLGADDLDVVLVAARRDLQVAGYPG